MLIKQDNILPENFLVSNTRSMQIGTGTYFFHFSHHPGFVSVPCKILLKKPKIINSTLGINFIGEIMEGKEKGGKVIVNGNAQFDENHKLIIPKKKKKTAEELLKELPSTPQTRKASREIAEVERKAQETKAKVKKPKHKEIKAETMVEKICKCDSITSYYNGYDNVIKCEDKTICWISDRGYGIALSTWGQGGKDWNTTRIYNQKQMYDAIDMLKSRFINGNIK